MLLQYIFIIVLFYFQLLLDLLLWLVYELDFIIGVYAMHKEKHSIGFTSIRSFRNPLGVWNVSPLDKGGLVQGRAQLTGVI